MLHISDSYIDIRVSLNEKNSSLISLRQRILWCLRIQEVFCYVSGSYFSESSTTRELNAYKLKPVVNYHLGWGGRGWVGGFLGMTRLSECTVEEGLVFANIALKETI